MKPETLTQSNGPVLSAGATQNTKEVDYYTKKVDVNYRRYKNIPMICETGLHEWLGSQMPSWALRKAKILDVGCGRGALSLRLAEMGHEVHAIDKFNLCMCRDQVKFIHGDATKIKDGELYDLIFMVEIIEHLYSPMDVLASYAAHLKPGGKIIVTTPNVDSDWSRAHFLLKGTHWYFEPNNVSADGHVTPIHKFQMHDWAREIGLRVVYYRGILENRTDIRFGLLKLFYWMMRFHHRMKGLLSEEGKIGVYVLAK